MSGFRLSPLQQGMLYQHLRAPNSGVDIEQMVVRLSQPIDPLFFRRAWALLANAHAVFRSSFVWDGLEQPQQIEHAAIEIEWEEHDWRDLPGAARDAQLDDFLKRDRARGFDLKIPPLCRGALFRFGEAEWVFVWTFHHISADGQAYPTLIREAFAAYEALCAGKEPVFSAPPPYRDFIAWLDQHLVANESQAKSFWQENLRGFTAPTPLPSAAGAEIFANGVGEQSLSLSLEATAQLRTFAEAHDLGMSTLVQAAWALLLSAHSNEDDVVFGETRACRRGTIPGAETIIGGLINTVPVRVHIDWQAQVGAWLTALRSAQRALRAVEHTPLADIQRWSEVPAKAALFDSLIVFTPRLIGAAFRDEGGAWAQREIRFIEQTSFPLTLFGYNENALLLKLAYDRARFSDTLVARCLHQLEALLEAMPLDPERRLAALPRIGAAERQLLLADWNNTARAYEPATIHALIERQVARTPDATAIVFRDRSLTYRELNAAANQLARRLKAMGAGPGKMVGIFLRRSTDLMVALLGTLKAGAAYLPLDPAFPAERLAWMLEDTAAPIVITQGELASAVPARAGVEILALDGPGAAAISAEAASDLGATAEPSDLAYVIFTSGSTGRPKGVMIEHRNVANFFVGMDEALQFRESGTWLAVTSISFDISVLELFWTLARGFKVVIQEEALAAASLPAASTQPGAMAFSLFYFAADAGETPENKYRLLMEGARYADANEFSALWTPERHFHPFGGLYPNPALTSAALAAVTSRIHLRAGSIVLPLHNPIRVAEEWAVVDNLSGGRVGLSFASGWHANDFALMPQNYRDRKALTFSGIETIRKLWRGESVAAQSGSGERIEVKIFPAPLQKAPPVWVTAATNIETFRMAGEIGANVLTNLLGQKVEELAGKIAAYRAARRDHGHAGDGIVSLMLHTFVGADLDEVRRKVRRPFIEYLKTSTDLVKQARWEFPAFATARGLSALDDAALSPEDVDALMEHAFDRYFETSGLFGTPETCLAMVDRLKAIGVNEIACLIDFGVDTDSVLQGLTHLNALRQRSNRVESEDAYAIPAQLKRHQVTHLQCTPSLASVLAADAEAIAALRPLRKLLLGGEALPPALAARLAATIAGDLVNMYGPTETTVWSATAMIDRAGGPVTIGRPIANTQIYLVDRQLQLAPLGAPGELLIGGDGVTRGYLNRAELTADRFISDRFGKHPDARLYRTGDLARYREDGRIEFLGRLDHQAKIRGYRIELGEIEAALAAHPSVKESVVVVRESAGGERSLVAYVAAGESHAEAGQWQQIWDEAYGAENAPAPAADPTLNTAGWISSFTGEPIPEAEMREWVERTVERIAALKPQRVLEIGCGMGMLLLRLAPQCQHYHGVDFSPAALRYVKEQVQRLGLTNVELQRAAADALTELAPGSFDAIVLNSVIQYFPSVDYLVKVIEGLMPLLAPHGAIFIGDVRDRRLLKAFHVAVELAHAPDALELAELRRRVAQRARRDRELVLDPAFFDALSQHMPGIRQVDILLKRGRHRNEMNCFRYDVVLRRTELPAVVAAERPLSGLSLTVEQIRDRLAAGATALSIVGIPNPRVAAAVRAATLIAGNDCPATAGALRREVASDEAAGIDPEDLYMLDATHDCRLVWSEEGLDRYDALLQRRAALPSAAKPAPRALPPRRPWNDYANAEDRGALRTTLPATLKETLQRQLPDYMIPSVIMVLEALPRTPNGKLDRKALPAPERVEPTAAAATAYAAPQSELETTIANVWRDVLNLERVGAHDNFFDLGANSLLMMQANARLKELLKRNLRLVDLFQYPTVSALAAHLGRANDESGSALEASQQRGQARLDALRRRRAEARK